MSTEVKPYESPPPGEFEDYRAISAAAVTSVLLGLLSGVAFINYGLVVVPLLGIASGLYGLSQIRKRSEELTGRGLAWVGTGLSLFCLVFGPTVLMIVAWDQIPPGCLAISYEQLQPEEGMPGQRIPPSARQLDGKKVYIQGYVYPGAQTQGIKQFLLVRDKGSCCFGRSPKLTDRIQVTLDDPLRLTYSDRVHSVAGVFHVPASAGSAVDAGGGVYYHLSAFHVR